MNTVAFMLFIVLANGTLVKTGQDEYPNLEKCQSAGRGLQQPSVCLVGRNN